MSGGSWARQQPPPGAQPPALPRREPPACGHTGNYAVITAVHPAGDTSNLNPAITFNLCSITGGQQELTRRDCEICRQHESYEHRQVAGDRAADIGDDVEVVRAALYAVLAQPDAHTFLLVVNGDGDQWNRAETVSYVLPRHQLPAFRVTPSRSTR